MATSIIVQNKRQYIPGAYSEIKSGIKNPALALGFGNTLVIQTSANGELFGGGAGINGTLKQSKDSLYTFDNSRDYRNFQGGGLWWLLAGPLFLPGGGATAGVSSITHVRAATTVPAEIEVPFGAQDSSDSDHVTGNDGSVTVQVRDEGVRGNGAKTGSVLTKGYGALVKAGVADTNKFIVQFWRGTFKGLDTVVSDGTPYDGLAEASCVAELVAQSPEISNVTDLVAWMTTDYTFNFFFKLKTSTIAGTDIILFQDITASYLLASGGTESYSAGDLSDVLEAIADLNFDFVITDQWGANAYSTSNLTILDYITNTAKIKPDLYVAGGKTISKWHSDATSSVDLAQAFDSMFVTLVHGGVKKTVAGRSTFKEYDSIYHAANALGREAGLEPQVPLTLKGLGIQGELHQLTDKEATLGLQEGVLMSRLDSGSFEVIKGVNTLQNNDFLVNPDGTTHDKQLARIIRQLNKEIVVNSKQQLLKKQNGSNRNTVSTADVKAWLEQYLHSKTAQAANDNLILSFSAVTVVVQGDAYFVTYAFVPNFSVSFLVFVGTIIDPTN